jgi:hypothetical protein
MQCSSEQCVCWESTMTQKSILEDMNWDRGCGGSNNDCKVMEYAGDYTILILVIMRNETFWPKCAPLAVIEWSAVFQRGAEIQSYLVACKNVHTKSSIHSTPRSVINICWCKCYPAWGNIYMILWYSFGRLDLCSYRVLELYTQNMCSVCSVWECGSTFLGLFHIFIIIMFSFCENIFCTPCLE